MIEQSLDALAARLDAAASTDEIGAVLLALTDLDAALSAFAVEILGNERDTPAGAEQRAILGSARAILTGHQRRGRRRRYSPQIAAAMQTARQIHALKELCA